MPRRDLYRTDVSDRERSQLEYVLREEKRKAEVGDVPMVSVTNALAGESVFAVETSRNVVRVLFISRDETLLNPTQQSLDGFINLSDLFDEVHILILRTGIAPKYPVLRVAKNVWLYTASARHWWWTPIAGMRLIREQLEFVGGLRPDLIVARDPFESGVVAYLAGRHYGRPTQVHVLQDYEHPRFRTEAPGNRLRRFVPRYLLPKFASVRTERSALGQRIGKRFSIPDLAVLPRFTNYESLITVPATIDLKVKYKPFSFVILYIGYLGHESTAYRVIDAARTYLKNPRVGLVIVGEGPARAEFKKRTDILGITKQVVFESSVPDVVAYLKSANVLVVSDTDADADDIALRGAAAGVPLIVARNQYRDDLFRDGESALLFRHDSVEELHTQISTMLNEVGMRKRLVEGAQTLITERFHADPDEYRRAYRASIEHALFLEEQPPPSATTP
jgi:glycosyltransferase involved in cell wall biosynthesis